MKKIHLLTILITLDICPMAAQIALYTENHRALFHIDAAKDNNPTGAPTALQVKNDVVVTAAGNMGIGTISPSTKLHIETSIKGKGFRYETPDIYPDATLLCDAMGGAYWGVAPQLKTAIGEFSATNINLSGAVHSANFRLVSTKPLSLVRGIWFISYAVKISNIKDPLAIGATLIRTGSSSNSLQVYGRNDIVRDNECVVNGSFIYESPANTNLYIFVGYNSVISVSPYYEGSSDLNTFSAVLLNAL